MVKYLWSGTSKVDAFCSRSCWGINIIDVSLQRGRADPCLYVSEKKVVEKKAALLEMTCPFHPKTGLEGMKNECLAIRRQMQMKQILDHIKLFSIKIRIGNFPKHINRNKLISSLWDSIINLVMKKNHHSNASQCQRNIYGREKERW